MSYRESFEFSEPVVEDSVDLKRLIEAMGNMDVNSTYAYMLVCSHFADTSMVVRVDDDLVGAVTGYRLPDSPETLFVWQFAVAESMRGQGLASRMLDRLVARLDGEVNRVVTTVSPSNLASRRMFEKLAARLDTELTVHDGFPASLFKDENHEAEPMLVIGPYERCEVVS